MKTVQFYRVTPASEYLNEAGRPPKSFNISDKVLKSTIAQHFPECHLVEVKCDIYQTMEEALNGTAVDLKAQALAKLSPQEREALGL